MSQHLVFICLISGQLWKEVLFVEVSVSLDKSQSHPPRFFCALLTGSAMTTTVGLCFPELIHHHFQQQNNFQQERQPNKSTGTHVFDWPSISELGSGVCKSTPCLDICPDPSPCHRFTYTCFSVSVQSGLSWTSLGVLPVLCRAPCLP